MHNFLFDNKSACLLSRDWSWKFTSPPEAAGHRIWEVFAYAEWDEWYLREPFQNIWRTGDYAPMCWQQADQEDTHYQVCFIHLNKYVL